MAKRKKSTNKPQNEQVPEVSVADAGETLGLAEGAEDRENVAAGETELPRDDLAASVDQSQPQDGVEPDASSTEGNATVCAEPLKGTEAIPGGVMTPTDEPPLNAPTDGATTDASLTETTRYDMAPKDVALADQPVNDVAFEAEASDPAPEVAESASEGEGVGLEPAADVPLQDASGGEPAQEGGETSADVPATVAGIPEAAGDATIEFSRLGSIIESLLFASDKALGMADLKRLLGERDNKKITAAVEALVEQRKGTGIEVTRLSAGWHLRTNAENAHWVSKLLVGKPLRLSRAMLETLAIVAYRQPVTRPEIDDIRGVDCGPVLKNLLERGLVRVIGKKEDVGRPMLYGTTPEFLRVFNLRDLRELPTLREFYDLSAEDQSRVESEHGPAAAAEGESTSGASATSPKPDVALHFVPRGELGPEPEENDPLLEELDDATRLAKNALGETESPAEEENQVEPEAVSGSVPPVAE